MSEEVKQNTPEEIYDNVRRIINHIRPYIMGDGGDVQLVSVEDGIVTIRLLGACVGCSMIDVTLNEGIKNWIMEDIPEIKDVVMVQDSFMNDAMMDYESAE